MSASSQQSFQITFLPSNRVVPAVPGESLLKAARRAGIHINASCGGSGACGKCLVQLTGGELTGGRSEKLAPEEFAAGFRQACVATISGHATIRILQESDLRDGVLSTAIPEIHRAQMQTFDLESIKEEGRFYPPVEKLCIELPRPGAHDNRADVGRLIEGLRSQYKKHRVVTGLAVLRKIRGALRENDFLVTVTFASAVREDAKSFLTNIQPGNWSSRNFGMALDIGTTTVYGQLLDLNTGRVLAEAGDYNGQISFGEDVITRIIYAEKPGGLATMHNLVVTTINGIIAKLVHKAIPPPGPNRSPIARDEINAITIAANTTMTHLLLELEPDNIRRAPYVPVSTFFPPIKATELGLDLPQAVALLFPAISSYVGGDIVAGVMGAGIYRTEKLTLYIDIGTNAEIVIGNRDWLVCAACSAGPAFEGGGITHGMRAASGAIEDFSLDPLTLEPMLITVDNKPPIGICGSGLLVIVATLFENGVINPDGKFNRIDNPRLRKGRSGYEYVLSWKLISGNNQDIVINEVDIENFIRAKAAIFAGFKTLVEEVGLRVADLEQIILAGAFGSYIDLGSAMTIGLLPEIDPAKVLYVGNGSLLGARMSELSNHIRQDVVEVVRKMTSFELSEMSRFKEQYVASLFLPHTDLELFPRLKEKLGQGERR